MAFRSYVKGKNPIVKEFQILNVRKRMCDRKKKNNDQPPTRTRNLKQFCQFSFLQTIDKCCVNKKFEQISKLNEVHRSLLRLP